MSAFKYFFTYKLRGGVAKKLLLYRALTFIFVCLFILSPFKANAAEVQTQQSIFGRHILYYDVACTNSSSPVTSITPGNGTATGLTFPSLNPANMADAINTFIKQENPQSKMKGLGNTIVATAKNSNVSPFLIVSIADLESSMSDPSDYNVSNGNNSFGRMANPGEPSFAGAGPNAGTSWYSWSSVKASVNFQAPENKKNKDGDIGSYLRAVFGNNIDNNDMLGLFSAYAGSGVAGQYKSDVKDWIDQMVKLAGYGSTGPTVTTPAPSGGSTGPTAGAGASTATNTLQGKNVYMVGDSITEITTPNLVAAFKKAGADPHIDGVGGSAIVPEDTPSGILSGTQIVNKDKDEVKKADIIVIAQATNEYPNLLEGHMKTLFNEVRGYNSDATVYWVNTFTNADVNPGAAPGTGTNPAYTTAGAKEKNKIIDKLSSTLGYTVIDAKAANIKTTDGIHPFNEKDKYAKTVVNGVLNSGPGAPITDTSTGGCQCSVTSLGAGALPSYIKQPYNSIFTSAAQKYGVDPAALVALFYNEQYGYINSVSEFKSHNMPDPPPPYGHGAPWATSSAAAQGAFQFIPSTWAIGGVDGNGDGKKDPEDLTDESFAAAKGLSNGLFGGVKMTTSSNESVMVKAASYYYGAGAGIPNAYGQAAGTIYSLVQADEGGAPAAASAGTGPTTATGCGGSPTATGYQNPLRDVKSLFKRRIDQGVDYGGHGNVYAIGNGYVDTVYSEGSDSGWPGGGWVSYTLSDGPAKGKVVYFAESCIPKVKHGDPVTASTVICYMNGDNDPWIETGWAASESGTQPLAQLYGGNGCCSTTAGVNFSDLLKSLGAPPGVLTNNPPIGSPLPSDFPTWK